MMKQSVLFWLLFLGHILGDYYFQSETMARRKRAHFGWLLGHCVLYAVAVVITLLPVIPLGRALPLEMWLVLGIPAVSHAVIDLFKEGFAQRTVADRLRRERRIFLIDQLMHMLILLGVAVWYGETYGAVQPNAIGGLLERGYAIIEIGGGATWLQGLRMLCVFLLIGKPANVAIRTLIARKEAPIKKADAPQEAKPHARRTTLLAGRPLDVLIEVMDAGAKDDVVGEPAAPETPEDTREAARTGRWIGVLERVLVVVLILMQEYGAIGLVFTAKSLTRVEKIIKDKGFAEYYLIGTLSSILFAMAALFMAQPLG